MSTKIFVDLGPAFCVLRLRTRPGKRSQRQPETLDSKWQQYSGFPRGDMTTFSPPNYKFSPKTEIHSRTCDFRCSRARILIYGKQTRLSPARSSSNLRRTLFGNTARV